MEALRRIGVMGAASVDDRQYDMAYKIGKEIAKRGAILVCGGRGGVMEAASKGACEEGGIVVGILPGNSVDEANAYVNVPVVTGMSNARNSINIWTSEVVIAICGSYGTLSEIALALKCGRPVIALESWRLDKIGCKDPLFRVVGSPEEAIEEAFGLLE